jgi:hypothetical protein
MTLYRDSICLNVIFVVMVGGMRIWGGGGGGDNVLLQDGEFQSSAFLTLDTLSSTSKGRMSPITTTILLSMSTLYEVTPVFEETKKRDFQFLRRNI